MPVIKVFEHETLQQDHCESGKLLPPKCSNRQDGGTQR